MKIKICCNEMKEQCSPLVGSIIYSLLWKKAYIINWDDEYPTYKEVFSIKYCPFCGKKIEIKRR